MAARSVEGVRLLPDPAATGYEACWLIRPMGGSLLLPLLAALATVPVPRTLTVTADTRLLVIAPHPDDEILGAGGLMRRVHDLGGMVRVVYLTDGDGYPEGVRLEEHGEETVVRRLQGLRPPPAARSAGGAQDARPGRARRHVSAAFRTEDCASSPTRIGPSGVRRTGRPTRVATVRRKSDTIVPNTRIPRRGSHAGAGATHRRNSVRPSSWCPARRISTPTTAPPGYFLADALGDVARVHPGLAPDVVNYIVHYNSWPFNDERAALSPPPGLRGGASGWIVSR